MSASQRAGTAFQRAATVLLMCGRSTLHTAWLHDVQNRTNTRDPVIDGLGFSTDGARDAKLLLQALIAETSDFADVAKLLADSGAAWDGNEPHPPDDAARRIVAAMRSLDGG